MESSGKATQTSINPPARPIRLFCAYSKRYRDLSTSGGLCSEAAAYAISRWGMAFGAAYAPDFRSVRTIGVDNMHDWFRLISKSKYTECLNADFHSIRKLLDSGRCVVFTGSPCQVKALMDEVGYGYGNLFTVDFLCHGYCRTDVLRRFVDDLESSRGKRVVSLDMRPRHNVKVRCVFEDGSVFEDEGDFQNGSVFKIFLNKAD